MDAHILKLAYPGGKSIINTGQFFPANADKRKKLLKLILESYEAPYEYIDQILGYLKEAINRMQAEAASAEERYKVFQQAAKYEVVYKGALGAAKREITAFENAKDRLIKEKQWWDNQK